MSNVDSIELAKFAGRAEEWWDARGAFRTLHEINDLRLNYIDVRAPLVGARVLDVGCGGGILSEGLARRGAIVVGVDRGEPNVEAARAHASAAGLTIDYRCAGVEDIATAQPGSFDIVTCLEVLEHVPEPASLVSSCAVALRPGGAAFFSTLNRNPKSFGLAIVGAEYVLGLLPRGTHEYLKLIQPAELAAWCRRARLEVAEVTGLHFNPLLNSYSLGGNVDVNYFVYSRKQSTAVSR
jgi:2-polyprenyl-6-hydroxyphenyl methylase/3-demethylubiquinone-9 3-methyltransferase